MKIRFTLNQVGLAVEYFKDGDWRNAALFQPKHIEYHGGIQNLKSKVLLQMTQRYELVQPGEYRDGEGRTVICV